MRSLLFLMVLFSATHCIAQKDTLKKKDEYAEQRIKLQMNKGYCFKGNDYITNKELYTFLQASGDKEVMAMASKYHKERSRAYVGFAFPALLLGALVLGEESISGVKHANGSIDRPNQMAYRTMGSVFLVAGIACPVISIVYKIKSKTHKAQAIQLYNGKF